MGIINIETKILKKLTRLIQNLIMLRILKPLLEGLTNGLFKCLLSLEYNKREKKAKLYYLK